MSWKLGSILIQTRWPDTEANLLQQIGLSPGPQVHHMHISDALSLSPSATAIAAHDQYSLVLNRLLPYDLSYEPPFSTVLDQQLKQLSQKAPLLCFFMDGITSTYGFCVFEKGIVTRARKTISNRLVVNYGNPYLEETGFENEENDEEARIFSLSTRWLNTPLDDLFFDPSFFMNVYDT
jgi:hypothetical protein